MNQILALPNINPAMADKLRGEIDKLSNFVSKGNALANALNSGVQLAIHAVQGEFVEAAAESAGFLAGLVAAGLVTGVGGAIAGVIGSPVWATAVVAGAAGFIVGNYVEGQFPGLVDEFSDFFQEDFYGGSGSPGGGGWDWPGLDPCDFDFRGECRAWH